MKRRSAMAMALAVGLALPLAAPAWAQDPAATGAFLIERGFLPGVWGGSAVSRARVSRYDAAWILAAFLDPSDHAFMVTAWSDVPPGFWALAAVNRVTARELLEADGAQFSGTQPISRGAFLVALEKTLRLRAAPLPAPPDRRIVLTDIRGFPGQEALQRAANDWLIVTSGGPIRPTEDLTRQDALLWVYRASALVDPGVASRLADEMRPRPTPEPSAEGPDVAPTPLASPVPVQTLRPLPRPTPRPADPPRPRPIRSSPPAMTPPPWLVLPVQTPTPEIDVPEPELATPAPMQTPEPVVTAVPQQVRATSGPSGQRWSLPMLDWSRRQGRAWGVAGLVVGMGDGRTFRDTSFYVPGGLDLGLSLAVPGWALEARGLGRWFPGAEGSLTQVGLAGDVFWQPAATGSLTWGVGLGTDLGLQLASGTTDPEAGRTFIGAGPSGVVRTALGPAHGWALARSQVGLGVATSTGPAFGIGGELGAAWPNPGGLPVDLTLTWRLQAVLRSSGSRDIVQGLGLGVGRSF
ncbi:MAG: hypothetical protein VKO64_10365 [Candidatus Sericytochromatia bacterium]|nr:hypothetical protein [Candidatus Sericytochromatia bacterium]